VRRPARGLRADTRPAARSRTGLARGLRQLPSYAHLARPQSAAPGAVEYVDGAVSGRLDSRPEFDRPWTEIRAGRVGTVVAAKLDRPGRSAKAVLELFDLCEQRGTKVVLTDQVIDTGTQVGRMLRTVLAAVAGFERDLVRERTQHAIDAFKAGTRVPKGKVGRPFVATPEKVARAVALRRDNPELTWSEIAERVSLSRETVRRAVREAARTPSARSDAGPAL
jgi:DNA invertase Pin-like site-specific DNA recombinase